MFFVNKSLKRTFIIHAMKNKTMEACKNEIKIKLCQKIAESLELELEAVKKEILSGPLINADETTVQVIKEPGRSSQAKSLFSQN
ncbi:MAG: transposase [Desulfobacteraceae bacterium]|nr:transposase [Desulfobacteraceae bacterium]